MTIITSFRGALIPVLTLSGTLLLGTSVVHSQTSDETMDALLDKIDEMRQEVIVRTPEGDGAKRADGYRQIFRMISQGTETFLDDHDTLHPRIGRCPSQNCKLGQDNPDNTYIAVRIDGVNTYRIFGSLNGGLGIFQIRNKVGLSQDDNTTQDMTINPDGSYEIILAPTAQPGNWLQTQPDSYLFLARFYYDDWENDREPSMQIEVVGDADGDTPVPAFSPARFALGAADAMDWFDQFAFFNNRPDLMPINEMTEPRGTLGFGHPALTQSRGRFDLAPGEALLLERPVSNAEYINIQLGTMWWTSLDYWSRQTSLSGHHTYVDPDNVIRYVISATDPGVPNWLDTAGLAEGTIHVRWLLADPLDPAQQVTAQVIQVADVMSHLPVGHPTVTAADRSQDLQVRMASYLRRQNPVEAVPPGCL